MKTTKLPLKTIMPHIAILLATLIWSAATPIIKNTLEFVPPATFLYIRLTLASVIVLPILIIKLKQNPIHKDDLGKIALLGVFSQSTLLIIFFALNYTTALDTVIISVLGTIGTVWAGHYFFREKVDKKLTLGLILTTLGTLIVMVEPILQSIKTNTSVYERIFGNFLALIYDFAWILYLIWARMSDGDKSPALKKALKFIHISPMKKHYEPLTLVMLSFFIGMITTFPFMLVEIQNNPFNILTLNTEGLLGILYMTIFSSIIAYSIYQWAIDHMHISESAVYGYLSPILTLPFAYILLGETPNNYMIAGSIVITIGVIIAESHNS